MIPQSQSRLLMLASDSDGLSLGRRRHCRAPRFLCLRHAPRRRRGSAWRRRRRRRLHPLRLRRLRKLPPPPLPRATRPARASVVCHVVNLFSMHASVHRMQCAAQLRAPPSSDRPSLRLRATYCTYYTAHLVHACSTAPGVRVPGAPAPSAAVPAVRWTERPQRPRHRPRRDGQPLLYLPTGAGRKLYSLLCKGLGGTTAPNAW